MTAPVATMTFRRVIREDFPLLADWLARPHVARWWNHETSPEAVERDFGASADGTEPSQDHLALHAGRPVGLVQFCHYADYPEYLAELEPILPLPPGATSIDYFVGEVADTGRGLGTAMIRSFCDRIWVVDPIATCIVVPVVSANRASWRALQRAGFRTAARGDLAPDNPVDDPCHEILWLDRPDEPISGPRAAGTGG